VEAKHEHNIGFYTGSADLIYSISDKSKIFVYAVQYEGCVLNNLEN